MNDPYYTYWQIETRNKASALSFFDEDGSCDFSTDKEKSLRINTQADCERILELLELDFSDYEFVEYTFADPIVHNAMLEFAL